MLSTQKSKIINEKNKEIILRGVNLGGWLMMEGYILGGRNIPEQRFKKEFAKKLGREELKKFEQDFRANFIQKEDIKKLKNLGINCLRLPFNFRLIKEQGLKYLDKLINWCREYKIYAILDMHSAPGSQNADWHSDSYGQALLWEKKEYQEQALKLWRLLASHYKDESTVAGYDILNEPVVNPVRDRTPKVSVGRQKRPVSNGVKDLRRLKKFYEKAIETIRQVDKQHIIFLEGSFWAQNIDFLGEPEGENIVYSIHFYQPLDFSFNFRPDFVYPGKINGEYWNKKKISSYLNHYYKKAKEWKVPIYVGEFGINYRWGCSGELEYLKDILEVFAEFGFHWAYWTYKAVCNRVYPDGIYQYFENPDWVGRERLIQGWETFSCLWKRRKKEIVSSWRTENFKENREISCLLKEFLRKNFTNCKE